MAVLVIIFMICLVAVIGKAVSGKCGEDLHEDRREGKKPAVFRQCGEDKDYGKKRINTGKVILLAFSLICLLVLSVIEKADINGRGTDSEREAEQSAAVYDTGVLFEKKPLKTEPGIRPPVFSEESGFYDEPFLLEIQAEEGSSIYYTLDCSIPTKDSNSYESPIYVYDKSSEPDRFLSIRNVQKDYLNLEEKEEAGRETADKAFIIRAAAFDREGNSSEVVTKTYFVDAKKYSSKTVISLVADPPDLFDPEKGIYVTGREYDTWYENMLREKTASASKDNPDQEKGSESNSDKKSEKSDEPEVNYMQRGQEWERKADFTLFKEARTTISQPVGIRIQGNTSREFKLKRFSIFSRKEYSGSKWFDAPIFGNKKTHSVMTRNSFLNALSLELAKNRYAEAQPVTPVVLFLNGELWYDNYFLVEKYSPAYFAQKYGLHQENIRIIKTTFWDTVDEENRKLYGELLAFLEKNDLADPKSYEQFGKLADLQSYIDYWCINMYLNNEDAGETLNVCLWRTDIPENGQKGDGRWRWALQDLDLTWGRRDRDHHGESAWEVDSFSLGDSRRAGDDCRSLMDQPIFLALKKNSDFKRQFVLTFMDLVNTAFRPETVLGKIEKWENENTNPAYREFFSKRAEYIVPCMAKTFGLSGTKENVTLSINDSDAGIVRLNTIEPDLSEGKWSGEYYTDYPVTVSALAEPGYRFSHWEIGEKTVTEETAEVSPEKNGISVHAVFVPR